MPQSDTESARSGGASRAFHCSCRHGALDAAWIHASGALDFATSPELERALADAHAHARLVVLDLRELTFMGCAGMHAIVEDSRRARQAGGRLVPTQEPPRWQRAGVGGAGQGSRERVGFTVGTACPLLTQVDRGTGPPAGVGLPEL